VGSALLLGAPQGIAAQYAPTRVLERTQSSPQWVVPGLSPNVVGNRATGTLASADSNEPRERKELPPGFVGQQVLAGVGGTAAGALLGGLVGAMTTDRNGGLETLGPFVMGMFVGGMLGSAVTVQWYSRRAGFESPIWATVAGTVVGLAGGPLFLFTVPLGSTIGFNLARK
jgi:hypothetical protein